MSRICVLLLTILVLSKNSLVAQHYLPLAISNYGGIYSANYNPANVVHAKQGMGITIANFNTTINNDQKLLSLKNITNIDSNSFIWVDSTNKDFNFVLPQISSQGPSVFYSKRFFGFALSSKLRAYNQVHSFSTQFIPFLTGKTIDWNQPIHITEDNGFSTNMHVFGDIQASGGIRILKIRKHELNAGIGIKYIIGFLNYSLVGNKLDATINTTNHELDVKAIDIKMTSNVDVPLNNQLDNFKSPGGFYTFLKNNSVAGHGLGYDIGATYTFYGSDLKNFVAGQKVGTYLIKLSASIIDIGSVTYKKGRSFSVTGTGKINDSTIRSLDTNDIMHIDSTLRKIGFTVQSSINNPEHVKLPTTLFLQADVHVLKNLYINATLIKNVVDEISFSNYNYDQLIITPRFESKMIEFALPITYNMTSKDMKIGAGFRFGPVYFGSTDALLFFTKSKGANLYLGTQVAIQKKQNTRKKEKK